MRGGKPVLPTSADELLAPGAAVRGSAPASPISSRATSAITAFAARNLYTYMMAHGATLFPDPKHIRLNTPIGARRSPNFFRRINVEKLGTQNMDTPAAIAAFVNGEGGIYPTGHVDDRIVRAGIGNARPAALQKLCGLSLSAAVGRACRVRQRPQLGRPGAQAQRQAARRPSRASSSSWPRTISTGREPATSPRSRPCSTTRASRRCRTAPTLRRSASIGRPLPELRAAAERDRRAGRRGSGGRLHRAEAGGARARRRRAAGQPVACASRLKRKSRNREDCCSYAACDSLERRHKSLDQATRGRHIREGARFMQRTSTFLWSSTAMAFALVATPALAQDAQTAAPNDPECHRADLARPTIRCTPDATMPCRPRPARTRQRFPETKSSSPAFAGRLQSARNIKRNSVADRRRRRRRGHRQAARHHGLRNRRAHSGHPGRARRRRSEPGASARPRQQLLHNHLQRPRDLHRGDPLGRAAGFPGRRDLRRRSLQDVDRQPGRAGLAGLINVRSRRPVRLQGLRSRGIGLGNYPKQSRDFKPNAQFLISDRWRVGDGEFGALINFSYTRLHYQDSIRRHGFFVANLAGGRSPDLPELHYQRGRPLAAVGQRRAAVSQRRSRALRRRPVAGLSRGNHRPHVAAAAMGWRPGYLRTSSSSDGHNVISGTVTNPGRAAADDPRASRAPRSARPTPISSRSAAATTPGRCASAPTLRGPTARFNLQDGKRRLQINTNNYTVNWYHRPARAAPARPSRSSVSISPIRPITSTAASSRIA